MITQFQKIKNIGCYEEYLFDSVITEKFNKVNILYGNNGSGKTTFSNLLFLLSRYCKNKTDLYNELIDENSELEIFINDNKVTAKNITTQEFDLYVFNSKFISDSVYNGTTSNIELFSNEVKLTNEAINLLDNSIRVKKDRFTKVEGWATQLQTKLDNIWDIYKNKFNEIIQGARLTNKPDIYGVETGNIANLKKELKDLYTSYENKAKEELLTTKLNTLKSKVAQIKTIDINLDEVVKNLESPISDASKTQLQERINSLQSIVESKKIETHIGDLSDWYKKGGRLLHLSKDQNCHCPLCNTDLSNSIDSILDEYSKVFSGGLDKLFTFLNNQTTVLADFIQSNNIESNKIKINDIISLLTEFSKTKNGIDFNDNVTLNSALSNISTQIKLKKKRYNEKVEIDSHGKEKINSYNEQIDSFKIETLAIIDEIEKAIQGQNIDTIISQVKRKIKQIATVEYNLSDNVVISNSKKNNSQIAVKARSVKGTLTIELTALDSEKKIEIAKLNAESKYVNIYLKHFGIDHFEIDTDKNKQTNNLIVHYTNGKLKNKIDTSLSEGEKTALAFAYFVSKLRVEKIESKNIGFQDCIIVIDDPISSLDDNRLFQTANLIDSLLFYSSSDANHYPKQLFVLSHNITFIKYLSNALKGNDKLSGKDVNLINDYFLNHNNPKIRNIPTGLKNFTNTYIIKLNEIIAFRDNKLEYEKAKNYLANYIRIVLETFLSFKLAIVNESNNRLPGLSHLITKMVSEFNNIDDIEIDNLRKDTIIKRLNHLKKIADHESHGSIHKAEEFSFIAEKELKDFAKATTQVILYIDKLHFSKIKNHSL
ncbi:AAA family ATPase [Sphingobacterium hotanense]|uniref:AAA family ATPase n=1 Tax=Sphingobacterium hotanense TaxID=649196 RepID=A0ABT7NTB5_9SPHI|nr:AAA family ATPase [Sphingobacterium hotanense]MDM1050386.1 AAA family ATPase [Sphingobacterium hotanense]